jgi:hypothetical protein
VPYRGAPARRRGVTHGRITVISLSPKSPETFIRPVHRRC